MRAIADERGIDALRGQADGRINPHVCRGKPKGRALSPAVLNDAANHVVTAQQPGGVLDLAVPYEPADERRAHRAAVLAHELVPMDVDAEWARHHAKRRDRAGATRTHAKVGANVDGDGAHGGSEPLSQERLVARRGKLARERDDEDGVKAKPREHAHAVLNRKQRVVDDRAGEEGGGVWRERHRDAHEATLARLVDGGAHERAMTDVDAIERAEHADGRTAAATPHGPGEVIELRAVAKLAGRDQRPGQRNAGDETAPELV